MRRVLPMVLAFQAVPPTWSSVSVLLHPRSSHALTSTPASLYVLAGTSASGTPVLHVERYSSDPEVPPGAR